MVRIACLASALLLLPSCAAQQTSGTSGSRDGRTQASDGPNRGLADGSAGVIFDIYERGSDVALTAAVWVVGDPDRAELVSAGSTTIWTGLGLTTDGFAHPFVRGEQLQLLVWAPDHELTRVEARFDGAVNTVRVPLQLGSDAGASVPGTIKTRVLDHLPPSEPLGGN